MKDAFMNKSRLYPNPNPNDTTPYSAKKKKPDLVLKETEHFSNLFFNGLT